jgi:hypothetical protein
MPRALTEIQKEIMQHIALSAGAAETAAGVNGIWLRRSHIAANLSEVESALEGLVELRYMEKHTLPGGATVYRRVQDVVDRAQEIDAVSPSTDSIRTVG